MLGYEKYFTGNLMAKVELYYQYLYNLPVENNDTSYYATINEGLDYRYVDPANNRYKAKRFPLFTIFPNQFEPSFHS